MEFNGKTGKYSYLAGAATCAIAVGFSLLLQGCLTDGDSKSEKDDHSALCTEIDDTDNISYRVITPNGGEVFHVGQTMRIKVCSEDTVSSTLSDASLHISLDGGELWLPIISERNETNSVIDYVIPDSIQDGFDNTVHSTVSDNCLIRITDYRPELDDFDVSDAVFSIKPAK